MRSLIDSKASTWRWTFSRHLALNSAMPYASMSGLPVKPSSFSTASSTGRPWQSQPALAGDVVALHRPVAGEDVLEDAGLDVVGARHAVGGRRPLVEGPRRSVGGGVEAALEHRGLAPAVDDLVVEGREVDVGRQRVVTVSRGTCSFESGDCSDSRDDAVERRGTTLVDPRRLGRAPTSFRSGSTGSRGGCGDRPFFRCSEVISRAGRDPRAHTVPGSLRPDAAATRPRQS